MAACIDDGSPLVNNDCVEVDQTRAQVIGALANGQSQVRVNLVSRLGLDVGSGEGISTRGVELYRGNTCFRVGGTTLTRLGTVENDMGGVIADGALDLSEMSRV